MLVNKVIISACISAKLVASSHLSCVWKPNGNSPPALGAGYENWSSFCTATRQGNDWICDSHAVATLVDGALNFNTPCGGGGYGYDHDSDYPRCRGRDWQLCGPRECYAMDHKDDCRWPHRYDPGSASVTVYKRGLPGADLA